MLVGVPKEIKTHEYRVGLVPGSVRELIHHGHKVLVESGGGATSLVRCLREVSSGTESFLPRRLSSPITAESNRFS